MRHASAPALTPKEIQRAIDAVTPPVYADFRAAGVGLSVRKRRDAYRDYPALKLYDMAFEKVLDEARNTTVEGVPAVWLVYNAGVIVKTPKSLFSIDLAHRLDVRFAEWLDFALLTHNHLDHFSPAFLSAMDGQGKTIVSNFFGNYGAQNEGRMRGGYTRRPKTFEFGDVTVRTDITDHNGYLLDFTTTFEVTVGGWTLYHTGDTSTVDRLAPSVAPDLWIVHPRCGLNVADGVRKFHPKMTAIVHLAEMGHGQWRWTLADGREEAARAEAAGTKAVVPFWGERIV